MHFTYSKPGDGEDLQQGDILLPTAELNGLIKEFHPYYSNTKFIGYLVTTQSCDLVRRGDKIGAPYISLCAVKAFAGVLDREIKKYQTPILIAAEAVSSRVRDRLIMFIERMLNNNHPEYFYLHEDLAGGLPERSCAYLRLTISLKSDHYDTCLAARKLALEEGFQSKLGWLIGNLYSRVGTEDWSPNTKSEEEWKNLTRAILEENIVLIDDKKAEAAKKQIKLADVSGLPSETIRAQIDKIKVRNRKEEVLQVLVDQIRQDALLDEDQIKRLNTRLSSNPTLAALLK